MPELLRTSKRVFLPDVENIKDPETKKAFEDYNKAFEEFVIAVYSDIVRLHERIAKLEV